MHEASTEAAPAGQAETPDEGFPTPAFVRYMVGEGISMTGTWMQAMAAGWVMASLTSSAKMLGLVNLFGGIPMIALAMTGGLFADKFDKRYILHFCQIVQIVLALTLGYLIGHNAIAMWHILVAALLLGISNAFELPAAAALVPELVGKKYVAKAVALDRAVFHGTRLIGPALAGYLVGHYGASSAYYLNALTFLALMIALYTLPARAPGTAEQEEKRKGGMGEGAKHILRDRPSFAMILLMATNTVFVFPVMIVLLPLYAKNVLLLNPSDMGWLMFSSGIGSLTGSLGILKVSRTQRPLVLASAVILICIALTSLSRADQFLWAAGSLTGLALGVSTLVGLANTVVQERAPAEIRGRVSAIAGLSFFGLLPFAGMIMASVADWIGIRDALLTAAGAYALIGLWVLVWAGKAAGEELSPPTKA